MAIPPFNNTRLNPHEDLTKTKQEELFDGITRNLEDVYSKFSTSTNIEELRKRITAEFVEVLGAALGVRISFGVVNAEGTKVTGSGFNSVKTTTGVYALAFEKAFKTGPAVIPVDASGQQRTASVAVTSSSTATVTMSNGTGAKENIQFAFIAIG